jgi:enoyl-CoA hydratase/carnithine racemase
VKALANSEDRQGRLVVSEQSAAREVGALRWDWLPNGVVDAVIDEPGRRLNTITRRYYDGMEALLADLEANRDTLRGVVLSSAKTSFFSGEEVGPSDMTPEDITAAYELTVPIKNQLRRLERIGRPVAAALTGSAVAGGLEIGLACHYRVGLDAPEGLYGLGEVTMGGMPGAGGLVRVTRLLGVERGFLDVFGTGVALKARDALRIGLLDELASDRYAVRAAAHAWVNSQSALGTKDYLQRWEHEHYQIPGGVKGSTELQRALGRLEDHVRASSDGTPQLVTQEILQAAVETTVLDIDEALEEERRHQLTLLGSPLTPVLAKLAFVDVRSIRDGFLRPPGDPLQVNQIRVLGETRLASVLRARAFERGLLASPDSNVVDVVFDARDSRLRVTPAAEPNLNATVIEVDGYAPASAEPVAAGAVARAVISDRTYAAPVGTVAGLLPIAELIAADDDAYRTGFDVLRVLGYLPIRQTGGAGTLVAGLRTGFLDEVDALLTEGFEFAEILSGALVVGFDPVNPLTDGADYPAIPGLVGVDESEATRQVGGRLLAAVAKSAVLTLEQHAAGSAVEVDVAARLGVGFPSWTGGATEFAKQSLAESDAS